LRDNETSLGSKKLILGDNKVSSKGNVYLLQVYLFAVRAGMIFLRCSENYLRSPEGTVSEMLSLLFPLGSREIDELITLQFLLFVFRVGKVSHHAKKLNFSLRNIIRLTSKRIFYVV
jgi:hypothetical protein